MKKTNYSKDVDGLTIELSDKPIDCAQEKGDLIMHSTTEGKSVFREILDAKEFPIHSLHSLLQGVEVEVA